MIESYGHISEEGKFIPDNKQSLAEQMVEWKGRSVKMMLTETDNTISGAQRRYFFGVVVNEFQRWFVEHGTQCSKQDVVDYLKDKFLHREHYNPITNSMSKTYISLSNSEGALTKEEFTKKKEDIQQFAASSMNDLQIPDPQEKVFK